MHNMTVLTRLRAADHKPRETAATALGAAIDGTRTDVSGQIKYASSDGASAYVFGQATVNRDESRSRNNRIGLGGQFRVNERLSRNRFSDSLSVYGEERFGYGQNQTSLTHVYGLTFNPSETWSFGANVENGRIEDDVNGAFDRTALAVSVGRATEATRIASNLELRLEDGVVSGNSRDRKTWLMRNTISHGVSEDWELLGRLNFAYSESDEADFLDADFLEGVIGAAYRPVDNDRLNALIKYTIFEDLAPSEQISSGGSTFLARQRSEIFSADAIYDLTEKLSIGAKYGFRSGEVALSRTSDDMVKSDAHLGVIRADYHVVTKWDILAEGRVLSSSLADDKQYGALVGLYRHVGDNAKVGVGYNFSKFSDDLTNFDTDSDGFFLNLVGKF